MRRRSILGIAGAAALAVAPAVFPASAPEGPSVAPIDAAGLKRAVESARGKVLVLNFWATWCDPCREEFPDLVRYATENASKVSLMTVSLDDPGDVDAKVRPFLKTMKAPGKAFVKGPGDPDAFISSVDPSWSGQLPATFVNAPDGRRVKAIHGGTSYGELSAAVAPLLPQAR